MALKLRLSPNARADLEDIWVYTKAVWSVAQAEKYTDALTATFGTLCDMPEIAREHRQFDPPVRAYPSGKHLVVYNVEGEELVVLRVLGQRQNWRAILNEG